MARSQQIPIVFPLSVLWHPSRLSISHNSSTRLIQNQLEGITGPVFSAENICRDGRVFGDLRGCYGRGEVERRTRWNLDLNQEGTLSWARLSLMRRHHISIFSESFSSVSIQTQLEEITGRDSPHE